MLPLCSHSTENTTFFLHDNTISITATILSADYPGVISVLFKKLLCRYLLPVPKENANSRV